MNQTISDMMTRRSVREFTLDPVSLEDIEMIIEAGQSAPAAHGKRAWHIAVLTDFEIRRKIVTVIPALRPIKSAPVAFLILGEPDKCNVPGYWPQNCGALTENILLAARSIGLGTTWCGIFPLESNMTAIYEVLNIPKNLVPFCVIAVGHPADTAVFQERGMTDNFSRVSWDPDWLKK